MRNQARLVVEKSRGELLRSITNNTRLDQVLCFVVEPWGTR